MKEHLIMDDTANPTSGNIQDCFPEKKIKIQSYHIKMTKLLENRHFAYVKRKAQISFAVTAKWISAFVFATCSTILLLSKSKISSL